MQLTNNASIDAQWAQRFEHLLGGDPDTQTGGTRNTVQVLQKTSEILTPAEMAEADRMTVAGGVSSFALMEHAGLAVAEAVRRRAPANARIAVMTGPGNNAGDGFIAARILSEAGYTVSVGMLTARDRLTGDAAFAAASWTGFAKGLSSQIVDEADLIVDALFGAGLDRNIEGLAAQTIAAVNKSNVPVIAVDLPSGINGATGKVMGAAIEADESVTFFRLKPGHLLLPGRKHCGKLTVADIGINPSCLDTIKPKLWHNTPARWSLPPLEAEENKYSRGHAVVVSGAASRTGAARLAARAALRVGSGLVTVAAPLDAMAVNAAHLTAIMLQPMEGAAGLAGILADERRNAVVIGPALGLDEQSVDLVMSALASRAGVVLDADALTAFTGKAEQLFELVGKRQGGTVMTPHDGEFARLFPDLVQTPSKIERARGAAARSGAVVVLKGADTVVAAPSGEALVASNAPPQLATAGSGDVLSGMIGGLLAQKMAPLEAAAAAVWLHGEAGLSMGRGLIAEDLPEALPAVFSELANTSL